MKPNNEFIPENGVEGKDLTAFEAYLVESRDHYRRLADRAPTAKECNHYDNLAAYYTRLIERFQRDSRLSRQIAEQRRSFHTGRFGSRARIGREDE